MTIPGYTVLPGFWRQPLIPTFKLPAILKEISDTFVSAGSGFVCFLNKSCLILISILSHHFAVEQLRQSEYIDFLEPRQLSYRHEMKTALRICL